MATPLTLAHDMLPDGTAHVTVTGEIDLSNADALARAIDAVGASVVLDLTGVEYLDSAGLAVLFAHADRLALVVGPLLVPVLTVSGLGDLVPVHRSADAPAPTDR